MTEGAVSVGIIGGLVSLELTRVLADGEDPLPTKDIRWWGDTGIEPVTPTVSKSIPVRSEDRLSHAFTLESAGITGDSRAARCRVMSFRATWSSNK